MLAKGSGRVTTVILDIEIDIEQTRIIQLRKEDMRILKYLPSPPLPVIDHESYRGARITWSTWRAKTRDIDRVDWMDDIVGRKIHEG